MPHFSGPLDTRNTGHKRDRIILTEFTYQVTDDDPNDFVTVPENFVSDLASVPRLFWSLFPPGGRYSQAAVTHDYLYATMERTRKQADDIFLDAMEVLGVPRWKRNTMYRTVRTFGWIPWMRHKKRKENKT